MRKKITLLIIGLMVVIAGCGVRQIESKNDLPVQEDSIISTETERVQDENINENAEINGETGWDIEKYEALEDIVSIHMLNLKEEGLNGTSDTYKIVYKSDECQVVAYLSIPKECIEKQESSPCVIFNRGGNRDYGANKAVDIAAMSEGLNMIVIASQYRGVSGGTGKDEFGGSDITDVIKLIDLCQEFSFVDKEQLYMMGVSRGGMMTYMACRNESRIKRAVVISGIADTVNSYNSREDMKEIFNELVGGKPEKLAEEYEKRSAVCWADEIGCPLLIIHSKFDEKVDFSEAEAMVKALDEAGKEYKFITYEDNVHGMHMEDASVIMEWFSE